MEVRVGDVVRLKKKHPCGSDQWQVLRVGADIGLKCQKCQRRVLLERRVFERKLKGFHPGQGITYIDMRSNMG